MSVVLCVFLFETTVLNDILNRFQAHFIVLGTLGVKFVVDLKHNIGAGLFSNP